jgi:Rha family phage regulatory protein
MNALSVIERNGLFVVDSREVAEMLGKEHDQLMRSIRTYLDYMESAKLQSQNFFIESTYINSQNKEQPCYLLTRKGCDMVANKMTGEKGVLFTAAYVTKFEEMENKLKVAVPQIDSKFLFQIAAQLEEKEKQIQLLTPAAEFGNAVSNNQGGILIRDYVKVLENDGIRIGQDKFFSWLHLSGYIYRVKGYKPQWIPYKQFVEQGLFRIKETPISNPVQGDWISYTIRITGKGQKYFYEKLKAEFKDKPA